ncbi:MAG: hypothetical protein MZV70_57865 [Desulfobacterales bacterium]|nr:hypothetical protein [Desulfobacterales bacterium]
MNAASPPTGTCRCPSAWRWPPAPCATTPCSNPIPARAASSAIGDPTEGALLVAAARAGMFPDRLQAAAPRVAEVPFDSNRKRMTTVHRAGRRRAARWRCCPSSGIGHVAFTKGAVDGLLALSAQVWDGERPEPLTDALAGADPRGERRAGPGRHAGAGRRLPAARRRRPHPPTPA